MLAPLLFLASGVVVSQSTILELYANVTFLIVLAYHLHSRGYRNWAYAVVGLGLAVHHLMGFMWIGLVVRDILLARQGLPFTPNHTLKNIVPGEYQSLPSVLVGSIGIPVALASLFYLYIPIVNREPFLTIAGASFSNYVHYFTSQTSLIGGLAIFGDKFVLSEDLRERVWDVLRVVLGGLGPALLALAGAARMEWKAGRVFLPLLVLAFGVYYATDLAPQVYTYTLPAFALAAILITKIDLPAWQSRAIFVFVFVMLGVNLAAYDIGRGIDQGQTARAFYESLGDLPPDSILWGHTHGWEKMTVELYNLDNLTNIDTLTIRQPRPTAEELIRKVKAAEADGRLFKTVPVDSKTLEVEIRPESALSVLSEVQAQTLVEFEGE